MKCTKAYLLLLSFILLFTLSACSRPTTADTVALGLYNLIVKQDTLAITNLGFTLEQAEQINNQLRGTLNTQLHDALTTKANVTLEDSVLEEFLEAYYAALQKLSALATVNSTKDYKHCQVTIATTYLDHIALDQSAIDATLKEIDIAEYSSEASYFQALTLTYLKHLTKAYENAIPSSDYKEATFSFILKDGSWVPEDANAFITDLCALLTAS